MKKKRLIFLMIPLLVILAGCSPASTESTGIWNALVITFAKIIVFFSDVFGDSLALGIIVTTLIIRLVMIPVYGSQIKSSEQMKELQPRLKAIDAKYPDKKNSESQRKAALEKQAIYSEEGINPLMGCLPLLLQMPLLIAFYEAIEYLEPPSSIPNAINGLQQLGADFIDTSFLGKDLGDPVLFLAIIAAATTYFSTYVTAIGQDPDAPGAGMIKGMMFAMPIMILVFGLTLPSAMCVYWIIGNFISIAQTLYFKRSKLQTIRQKKKIEASTSTKKNK